MAQGFQTRYERASIRERAAGNALARHFSKSTLTPTTQTGVLSVRYSLVMPDTPEDKAPKDTARSLCVTEITR